MHLLRTKTLTTLLLCCIITIAYAQNSSEGCKCGISNVTSPRGQVLAEELAGINEFPWQVGLIYLKTKELFCGASILTRWYLLSAARCFFVFNWTTGEYWEVNAGAVMGVMGSRFRVPSGPMTFEEVKTFEQIELHWVLRHEKYFPGLPHDDIALIHCADAITKFNEAVTPICLPYENVKDWENVYVSGWGQVEVGSQLPIALRSSFLSILPWNNCMVQNFPTFFSPGQMGCAHYPEQTACIGDFGGPVVYRIPKYNVFVQVGIVSYIFPCTFEDADQYPLFYTNVYNYIEWLQNLISESLCLLE